jgi:predicted transcriptional regulator
MISINPINGRILSLIEKGQHTVSEVSKSFECSSESIRHRIVAMETDGLVSKRMVARPGRRGGSREAHFTYTGLNYKIDKTKPGTIKPKPFIDYSAADLFIFRPV